MMITFYSTVDSSSLAILSYYRPIHRSVAEAATPYQSSLVCCRQQHSSSDSTNAANKLHVSSRQPHSRHSFSLTHLIAPVPSSFYFSPFLSVPHSFTLSLKLICSEKAVRRKNNKRCSCRGGTARRFLSLKSCQVMHNCAKNCIWGLQ